MYNPTPEQAEADRQKAYDTNTPHGVQVSQLSLCTLSWHDCRTETGLQSTQATFPPAISTRTSQRSAFS